MVAAPPLCATTVIEQWQRDRIQGLDEAWSRGLERMPELLQSVHATGPGHFGVAGRGILALVNEQRLRRILTRMLDEREFLSPFGRRPLPLSPGASLRVQRGESGVSRELSARRIRLRECSAANSNSRGPSGCRFTALIIRALLQYYLYYGDRFKIECPTGSGRLMNLFEVAGE